MQVLMVTFQPCPPSAVRATVASGVVTVLLMSDGRRGSDPPLPSSTLSVGGGLDQMFVDFANPKAPEHVNAPDFAIPRKVATGIRSSILAMTPRSVLSSQRALSYLVMTPRADGVAVENSASQGRFNANSKKPKITRGARESASDKPIFSKEEGYLDRAVARRAAEQRETKLVTRGETDPALSPLRHEASGSTLGALKYEDFKLETVRRGGSKSGDLTSSLAQNNDGLLPRPTAPPSSTNPPPPYNSEMGARLASITGVSGDKLKVEMKSQPQVMEKFLSGRMSYEFDLDKPNQLSPSTVMHGRGRRESPSTGSLPSDLLNMVIHAFAPKVAGEGDIRVPESLGDDIFPDAGEYTPNVATKVAKSSETSERVVAAIFKGPQRSVELPASNLIPESIRNLTAGQVIDFRDEFAVMDSATLDSTMVTGDYDECYPGVYESASILPEADDEHAVARSDKPLTRRQLAAKDRQKLDRQLGRVTKILESRRKGKDREE